MTEGMGGGGGYAWIGEMVSQGITDVSGAIQRFYEGVASDPCQAVLAGRDTADNYESEWLDYSGWLGEATASMDWAVGRALSTWGEATDVAGVDPFVDVLWDVGARPRDVDDQIGLGVLLGIFTWGIGSAIAAADLREQWSARLYRGLPPGGGELPGTNNGYRLTDGVYLWAGPGKTQEQHYADGVVSGWRARQAYWSWRRGAEAVAHPSSWPDALTDLAYMTGSSTWRPGDPLSGYMGEYRRILDSIYDAIDRAEERCAVAQAMARANAETVANTPLDLGLASIEAEAARTKMLAFVALVAVLALRRGRK